MGLFSIGRFKTPTVIQMEAVECGAAALSMIIGYYGRYVSLEELRVRCGVSRSGVNAYNMIQAAKYYGLEGNGYQVSYDSIREVELPAIIFWNNSHFVVLEGIRSNGMYINDPALGPRFVNNEEFEKSYSGISLELKPTDNFIKGGKPFSLWKRLLAKVSPYRGYLIFLLFMEFSLILLGLALPIFFQVFIDQVLPNLQISWKGEFFILFFSAILLVALLTWTRERFLNLFRIHVSSRLTSSFLWHVLHLPISFFTQRFGGEIIHRTLLNNEIANAAMGPLLVNSINLLLIGFYLAIIATYSLAIAFVGLLVGVFNLLLLSYVQRSRVSAYAEFQQQQAKVIGYSIDSLSFMETIKTNNAESIYFSKIAGMYAKNVNALQRFAKKDIWLNSLTSLSQGLSNILLLAIGFWYILEGYFTVGMLVGLQILLGLFFRPFSQLVQFGALLQNLRVDINRVDDVLANPTDPIFSRKTENIPLPTPQSILELKNVNFGYSPLDAPVITDCNLSLKKGEWIALVGGVGSGKSTLSRLSCQLFEPWSGQILYEGIPSHKFALSDLKKFLSFVDQDIILFAGSIKENLTLWDETLTEEEMIKAACDACIHKDILHRSYGYEGKINEGGTNFSQGQRQRLEIARALIHKPTLLIMDEATNSLDETLEKEVISNLRKVGLSCLFISHRLSAIKQCDRVIVLKNGRVDQNGTHEELSMKAGTYQDLIGGHVIG